MPLTSLKLVHFHKLEVTEESFSVDGAALDPLRQPDSQVRPSRERPTYLRGKHLLQDKTRIVSTRLRDKHSSVHNSDTIYKSTTPYDSIAWTHSPLHLLRWELMDHTRRIRCVSINTSTIRQVPGHIWLWDSEQFRLVTHDPYSLQEAKALSSVVSHTYVAGYGSESSTPLAP
jgi:hypothetical protein